jgi:hypothetical protein
MPKRFRFLQVSVSEGCLKGVSRWDLHYVETLEGIDLTVDPREAAPMVSAKSDGKIMEKSWKAGLSWMNLLD